MKDFDHVHADERGARRRFGGTDEDVAAPQGQALILELQRLRQAFEHDNLQDQRPPLRRPANDEPGPGARRSRSARPRRSKKKGKMGRVLDWLGPFGSQSDGFDAEPPPPRSGRSTREPQFMAPPPAGSARGVAGNAPAGNASSGNAPSGNSWLNERHARGPIIAPDDPSLMNMPRSRPEVLTIEDKRPPPRIEAPQLAPPSPAGAVPRDRSVTRVVRNGLTAGVAFLANRDGSADMAAAPGESIVQRAARAFEGELRTGLRVLLIVGGVAGGWMALVPLSGAVVVPGNLVVQSNVKTIQHPTGGVVAQIPVHNGMRVNAGDLLLRLDSTQAQASLQVVSKQLDEVRAKIARLVAERDGLPRPAIPPEMSARLDDNNVKTLLASEASLFRARTTARESQKELLKSKVSQLGEEIVGLEAQVASKAKQLELITGELTGVQELFDKRLVPIARLTALQRESARIEGERGQLISTIAETKTKVDEAKLQMVRLDQDVRTEVVKELGEAQGKEAELSERSVAARDVLERIEMRAPTSGVIHQLNAHTIGGVVRAGDSVMEVVPDSDDLQIEAKLQPNDIDQVRKGQQAFVRFSAFNQRVTPQLIGQVSYVSPDTTSDKQTNMSYFTVRIMLPEEERRRLAGLQLSSGMPAEVFMQTGSRTMLSYLSKPILDQFQRAFVER
ncbi:HlyD family type I secretion periplasmic adaptor subunit [Bradyrhizobium sp. 200]|uniref:HlyD family type I secretion periplasmic adaptor subunit n=1 Tax=Bradyrhizobium sp. 200 TaxID=2782665 RepID=UPI001FFFBB27|nr:HlyD family type I secretion periplasmic adaptor subunit [Bradyrhizobium sp. 200]UPJ50998.1 HlyD family type I secretion periplasmic adaptor subunit [Bradyrhizobium sp. 200]